jgi:hypothetical protein
VGGEALCTSSCRSLISRKSATSFRVHVCVLVGTINENPKLPDFNGLGLVSDYQSMEHGHVEARHSTEVINGEVAIQANGSFVVYFWAGAK